MRTSSSRVLITVLGLVISTALLRSQGADVLPGNRRLPTVELAASLADRDPIAALPEDLNNPFYPDYLKPKEQPDEPGSLLPDTPTGPSSNYELLETIAPELTPSGTMVLGGEPLLLFGQKKIRVGGELPIIYEGRRYTLIISAIESSFFTLRLGEAEYTRPIKP
ncbi:hypothetical protein [Actomonas aquatica]|uniref:Pilus assembly protein PilP n=1 Tax=Actomonas aquatica TaxID=2866162 RepID=A0ABZ1C6B5_9BACT|nr:hypothetical protein [Opitutus sp. WL0086]WRQ86798.1 hypothetical protein K1X11_018455 [Opitutus sp. WL0086]